MRSARWRALGVDCEVVVRDATQLRAAEAVVRDQLDELDATASRFRDSELTRLRPGRQRVGTLLAQLVRVALDAAGATDGLVDPTLGRAVRAAGYDRTFADVAADGPAVAPGPTGRWRDVRLDGDLLDLPDVELDLGATAKAWAADRAARAIGAECVVSLGGDVAAVGRWPIAVGDPGDRTEVVEVEGGLATSSTVRRSWRRGGVGQHHVVDPRTGRPAEPRWRTVSVAARSCVEANTASTAAVVLGDDAPGWLADVPARLVGRDGLVVRTGGWAA